MKKMSGDFILVEPFSHIAPSELIVLQNNTQNSQTRGQVKTSEYDVTLLARDLLTREVLPYTVVSLVTWTTYCKPIQQTHYIKAN